MKSTEQNDAVWVLLNADNQELLSYFIKNDITIRGTSKQLLLEMCNGINMLKFKYYSTREKRAEYIERINNHNQYLIWHEGWMEEYELCKK